MAQQNNGVTGGEPRMVIVSNRLPVTVATGAGVVRLTPSAGGLASGLWPAHERGTGAWLGWPGPLHKVSPPERAKVIERLRHDRLVPVELSATEIRRYYDGFANAVLWPVFHHLLEPLPLDSRDWGIYQRVNERFAELVVQNAREDDVIWVHDYHLMLVPELVRRVRPRARIGFFLHVPFPSSEVFRVLPRRAELLRGVLGADLVGFHTLSYMRHFAASLLRILGLETEVDRVTVGDRAVRMGAYPMGIDVERFLTMARDPSVAQQAQDLRRSAGGAQIILGVDRLDYTKGLLRRLLAFERLLETREDLRGRVQLVQVAVTTRADVHAYQSFKRSVDEMVGRINGRFGTAERTPIRYVNRGLDQRQVTALYRACDVMLVTPLRDGLNLVAKEFVASRDDHEGVLVISEFAGAAAELPDALSVNPYDVDGLAEVMARALAMPPDERRVRMAALHAHVTGNDVHEWVRAFLSDLAQEEGDGAAGATEPVRLPPARVAELAQAPGLLLFLDYDGTLVPFAARPELVEPDAELLAVLERLARRPRTHVHIVSGRARRSLERWFDRLPLTLHAEHGAEWRSVGATTWARRIGGDSAWKDRVRALLQRVARHVPGAFLEEKVTGLAWHYRRVEAGFAAGLVKELRLHLLELLGNLDLEIVPGDHVLEVRPRSVHKGLAVAQALQSALPGTHVVAVGDDRTDEDMFAAVPADGVTVRVGAGRSRARYRLPDYRAVRRLLHELAAADSAVVS